VIKLTLKQALIAAVAFIGFLGLLTFFAHSEVDPHASAVLKRWVAADLTNYQVNRTDLPLEEKAALLLEAAKVDFASISARGTANTMVFRVEIKPNIALPPDAPSVRYYRLRYSLSIGWEPVPQTGSALTYFLARFLL
jgi:hypothetical protein